MRKLKRSDVPLVTAAILKRQDFKCPLCEGSLRATAAKTPALDHDHATGFVRGVLCVHCNGIEGKVFNLSRRAKNKLTPKQWLANLQQYWETHSTPRYGGLIHHTHKTEEEARLARNAKARRARAKAKRTS
jgi:hypothetical protein